MSLETNEKLSIWRLLLNLLNPIRILIEVNTRFLIKWGRFIVFKQKEYSSVACLPLKSSQNHRFLNCLMSNKSNFSCFSCFVDIVLMDLWIKSHQITTQWLILYYYNPHQNLDHVHPETQTAAFHVRWITRLPSCIISFTAQTSPHVSSSKLPLFWILYNSKQLLRWDRIQRAWRMEISYLESPPLLNDSASTHSTSTTPKQHKEEKTPTPPSFSTVASGKSFVDTHTVLCNDSAQSLHYRKASRRNQKDVNVPVIQCR